MRSRPLFLLLGATVPVLLACDEEEGGETVTNPEGPTSFQVRLENVSQAYDFLASGVFDTAEGAGTPVPR